MVKQPRKRSSAKTQKTAKPGPNPGPAKKTKKQAQKPAEKKKPWGIIFWICFFMVVFILFIYNRENINRTLRESQAGNQSSVVLTSIQESELAFEPESRSAESGNTSIIELSGGERNQSIEENPGTQQTDSGIIIQVQPAVNPLEPEPPEPRQIQANDEANTPAATRPPEQQITFRDRAIYFINVDRDGVILRTRVNRSIQNTDSPLTDTISALLAGPTAEEQRRGLITLIPEGSRIMSATVRGNTAYINFSEDFQFNIYGIEGYAGALRQVVWTATEFPNVRDVQILIESRRIDFLGEGVWIGSPVSREML